MKMWCKKHGTIYQDKCYECEKEEMDKPIDWEEIRKVKIKANQQNNIKTNNRNKS